MMKTKWLDGLSNFIFWQVAWKLKKTSSVKNLFLTQIFFRPKKFDFAEKNFRSPIFFQKKDQGPGFSKKIQETRNWIILFFLQLRPQMK